MKERNKFILFFIILAFLCFCIIQFIIIPQAQATASEKAQDDAMTHDILAVMEYQSLYLGDNSNTVNLFYHLPLNHIETTFAINGDQHALAVNYQTSSAEIGTDQLQRELIYNATAAMALIANLDHITFSFSDISYSFDRNTLTSIYGCDLDALLTEATWETEVQDKLTDDTFVARFYESS